LTLNDNDNGNDNDNDNGKWNDKRQQQL